MSSARILVTGAAGFIGKDVVARLLDSGHSVKAMVRKTTSHRFHEGDNLEIVIADMRDSESLVAAVDRVDAVVHLAAAKSDEKESQDVNVEGAKRLIAACRSSGCRRLINISTQSTKILRKGTYARTKGEADRVFHESDLDVTSLLPSVVYGEEKSGVFGTVLAFVEKLPIVPVLGDGLWVCAPVYVGDLSAAIIDCLENEATFGKMYDIGGPDRVNFDELIDRLSAELGIRRPKLHIPFSVSLLAAQIITSILPNPPITVSNVLGSNQDTNIDLEPAQRDFTFNPIGLDEGIKRVLAVPGASPDLDPGKKKEELITEACLFGRYLVGSDPHPDLIDRYAEASSSILQGMVEPEIRFIHRHPDSLPFIDAAAGILRPESHLRQKLLIMTAILEASPQHADFFLRNPDPPLKLAVSLVWQGMLSAFKIVMGIPLFLMARRG